MYQASRFGDEEVSISVRNTFLHCAVQRTCSETDDAEEPEQPSVLRATTAPAPRLHDRERPDKEELAESLCGSENQGVLQKGGAQDPSPIGSYQSDLLEPPAAVGQPTAPSGGGRHGAVLLGRTAGRGRAGDGGKAPVEHAVATTPSWKAAERQSAKGQKSEQQRTTVMLRNLPNNYTRSMLLELLDAEGFAGKYDFLYMPIDFRTHAALGYGFVNMACYKDAEDLMQVFEGLARWALPSSKVCSASWSQPHQGLDSHIVRYRSSPLMHEAVPDEYRPILFSGGVRIPFPPPTKKVKPPRQGTQRLLV